MSALHRARRIAAVGVLAAASLTTVVAFAQEEHAAPHGEGATPTAAPAAEPAHGAAPTAHGEGAHAEGGHEAHGGGHGHGPAPINWTDLSDKTRPAMIALLINFGVLATLYYVLAKKPVVEGLKQRRINVGKDIEDARKMLDEAKERAKKYQADLKNADEDASSAKAALVTAGKGEAERLMIDAQERAERMKRDAERLIEQERKQVERDLLVETIEIAVTQAQKVLEKSATPEDHARLANELLAELAKKPAAARAAAPATRVGGAS